MLNKVACSYYNAAAIAENGDLYIWGSGSSGIFGSDTNTTSELPQKFPLEKISADLKANHVSVGPNHMAIVVTNKFLDKLNPKIFVQDIHRQILNKQQSWFKTQKWDLPKELQLSKHTYISKSDFLHFLDFVNSHIRYTTVEESELESFVDFFSLHHQDRVNLAQYIYCLDPTYFASDLVYTVGLNDNGRLGTGKPDSTGPAESRNSIISDVVIDEAHLNQAIALKKDRIQEISQVKIGVPVQKVSCGHKFTLALDMAGQIWAWGKGGDGCLGTGQLEDKWYPELINFTHFGNTNEEIAIIDISAGSEHCLAINKCNEIFSWGKGNQGRLGHDNEVASLIPKKIAFFTLKQIKVASISAGEQHSACITQNHELYTWGSGANYRLGHGSLHNSLKPERVQHISDHFVIKVSSGSTHTLCLTRDGHIFAMGSGINGRLGIDIAGGHDYKTPTRIAPYNEEVKLKSFVEVVAGPHQSFGLTDEGELLAWGSIKFKTLGIAGLKGDLHIPTPIHLGGLKFHFKKKKKKADVDNKNRINFDSYDLAFQEKLDKSNPPFEIVRVFCGETNTVYLMANGDIYICGSGQYGQLCINPETKGEEFCGDKAALKELFMEEEIVYSHTPIYLPINLEMKFKYVAIGLSHIIALTVEGQAFAWGRNTEGQLGIGSGSRYLYKPTLIEEVFVKKFAMCVASHTYSALLSESGEVWVFGSAEYGCLGINATKQNYDVPTPKKINNIPPMKYIAAAPQHMAALTTDGELYVWGNNNNGRLGIEGKNQKVWVPRKVTITNTHGHAMFKQVSCGYMHTLLLDIDGYVWGAGAKPYAGFQSDSAYRSLEEQNHFMLIPDLKNMTFLHISSGEFHNLAVSTNLQVYGWGKTDYGKLAQETLISINGAESRVRNILMPRRMEKLEHIIYAAAGVNHSTCLNSEGDAFVWGNVLMGRLGVSRDDIKLLKNLKKITNELNVLSLHVPHKLQAFFEEELTRKLKIFAKTSTKEAYDFNMQNNNIGAITFTEYENSHRELSLEGEDTPKSRILKKKFTFAPGDIQQASTKCLDNKSEAGKDQSDNDNTPERKSLKDSLQEDLEAEQAKSEMGDRFVGDRDSQFTGRVLTSELQVPTKSSISRNNAKSAKSVRSSNRSKIEASHTVGQSRNTDRFLIENYATQFKQHQAGLNVGQLKLQKELYDDETEYYEPSLYNRDADLDKTLKLTLEKITKQIDSMKLNFAANMVESQSIVQTSLHLLGSKTRTLKNFNPTVPSFILQNIQVYEGILSYLFIHPCYWYKMLKSRNMDHQMVLDWIYKIYRSDGEGRVVNLALSLALMLLEDEVGFAKPSSLEEVYVLTNYTKLYNFLIKSQECNRSFIKEIVTYIIQDVIIQEFTDEVIQEEQLIDEIDHNKDMTRISKGSKKKIEVSDAVKNYYNLDYHFDKKTENSRYGQFDKALERCLSLVKKLEKHLTEILSQPHFSVQGKISREICYLNARIIEEYRHFFEKKAQSSEGAYSLLDAQVTRAVREAELLVIDMFFGKISDYLVNYEIHGIQVPIEFKKLLSAENLKSIGTVITAYFQRKEVSNDSAYDKLNHYTQTMSKKYDTVKMFIQGMTAHDDFDLTLDNVLRVAEDSACFKDRYNSLFTVKDIIELQNSLAKLSKTPDFFVAGENDPVLVLLSYLEFGEYDLAKFPYQVLQNRVNLKINSKILHKNPEDKEIDIHRCTFCQLVYPKDFMGVQDMKLINTTNWSCNHCHEDNGFENRFCYACGSIVPDYIYQQRSIFKKYLPLVKKDPIIYEYLDFIKSQPKIFENDKIDTILTDLIESSLKEGNFEKSHQYSQVLHWVNSLTVHELVGQYSLRMDESSNETAISLLNQLLTYEYGLRKKHKVYLDKVESLLGKVQHSVNVAKRTCDEMSKKFDIIEAKVMVSHGKYNGLTNTALNAPSEDEEHRVKDKIAYSKIKPFGIFTSEELKTQKVLLSFILHDKVVPKITTNLKFYFFYREDIGFQVKVVFLEDTWINYFVRFGPWFTNEVALDQFTISSEHLLEMRRTAHYKAEVTFGYSTFSVEKLANLLDSILIKNYYHKVMSEAAVMKDKSKDQKKTKKV